MNAEDLAGIPAIDVRTIPPFERHARIFSIIEALKPHQSFAIVSDHEPRPLQHQLQSRFPGLFGWTYVEEGPEVWRVVISREAADGCGCNS